jgi:phosphopantothenoylcysteine decarboxylase / phosphopantothenate---cysteine ligase
MHRSRNREGVFFVIRQLTTMKRLLITAGPTREPIDPVRYVGNRSSGAMGAAIAAAALEAGHAVSLVCGPVSVEMPGGAKRVNVETAAQMLDATLRAFGHCDLLIMTAAVADYRPKFVSADKLERTGEITFVCEPTVDIVAAAGRLKGPDQRTVGFSLETGAGLSRAREKLVKKSLDLIVYNHADTIASPSIVPTLLYRDGRAESLQQMSKTDFAKLLVERSISLF